MSSEHLQVLEYVCQLVDLVDGSPDAVVAAVASRDPPLEDGRVFLTHLQPDRDISGLCNRLLSGNHETL